jgi:hypothetical protein
MAALACSWFAGSNDRAPLSSPFWRKVMPTARHLFRVSFHKRVLGFPAGVNRTPSWPTRLSTIRLCWRDRKGGYDLLLGNTYYVRLQPSLAVSDRAFCCVVRIPPHGSKPDHSGVGNQTQCSRQGENSPSGSRSTRNKPKGRHLSAEARKRISMAMKKRWVARKKKG